MRSRDREDVSPRKHEMSESITTSVAERLRCFDHSSLLPSPAPTSHITITDGATSAVAWIRLFVCRYRTSGSTSQRSTPSLTPCGSTPTTRTASSPTSSWLPTTSGLPPIARCQSSCSRTAALSSPETKSRPSIGRIPLIAQGTCRHPSDRRFLRIKQLLETAEGAVTREPIKAFVEVLLDLELSESGAAGAFKEARRRYPKGRQRRRAAAA